MSKESLDKEEYVDDLRSKNEELYYGLMKDISNINITTIMIHRQLLFLERYEKVDADYFKNHNTQLELWRKNLQLLLSDMRVLS